MSKIKCPECGSSAIMNVSEFKGKYKWKECGSCGNKWDKTLIKEEGSE